MFGKAQNVSNVQNKIHNNDSDNRHKERNHRETSRVQDRKLTIQTNEARRSREGEVDEGREDDGNGRGDREETNKSYLLYSMEAHLTRHAQRYSLYQTLSSSVGRGSK